MFLENSLWEGASHKGDSTSAYTEFQTITFSEFDGAAGTYCGLIELLHYIYY